MIVLRRKGRLSVDDTVVVHYGHELVSRNAYVAKFTKLQFRLAAALLAAKGALTKDDIAEALWGDDPSGGPDDANNCVHALLRHVRLALAPLGIEITLVRSGGGWTARVLPQPEIMDIAA